MKRNASVKRRGQRRRMQPGKRKRSGHNAKGMIVTSVNVIVVTLKNRYLGSLVYDYFLDRSNSIVYFNHFEI